MVAQPFRLQVAESALADLRERLARTRWPDEPPLEPWSTGASLSYLQDLLRYWQSSFDWRAWEAKLNAFEQYKVPMRGIDLHYILAPGRGPRPMPLLLAHGWPGSVFEFLKLIPLLQEDFTVVAPSLPGYGLSFRPGQARFGTEDIAECVAELMTDVLGFKRFGAQGGDWGASISSVLGYRYPERLTGIHLNLMVVRRDLRFPADSPGLEKYQAQLANFLKEETGYQAIQGTKPQTLAYGLSDSPAGLAAWLAEKFRSWSDCGGTIENAISRDEMLANISLYWFTGAIGSSFWPYYARLHRGWPIPEGRTIDVPTGYAEFPKEILSPPRALAQKTYTDIRRWSAMPKGGHFAALEQPELLAREVREFFSALR
ncbi:MAG: epoxide hydrolase [Betaproteobacteria bacterium]|nr:epoxide hydrolase [Betaproteobacteria bacterium]